MRLTAIALAILLTSPLTAQSPKSADTAHWLADYEQLKAEMTSHYANLEWAVERRGVDLKDLNARTVAALRDAPTDSVARRVLERFIATFGDGHLSIRWPTPPRPTTSAAPQATPRSVCERNGYRSQRRSTGIAFNLSNQFQRIPTPDSLYFPIGVLTLGKQRLGVIRISSFEDNIFPDLCERAAVRLNIAPDSVCSDGCEGALDRETGNEMAAALTRQVSALNAADIDRLVVDISANGGGTNWVEAAARTLSPKPLRAPRQGFIRHPHHARQLHDAIAGLVADSSHASGPALRMIGNALAILRAKEATARTICDRSALWDNQRPTCRLVFQEPATYSTGVLAYAAPGTLPQLTNCCALYYPSRYAFTESAYKGPLLILVDNNTASAAEYFAAMLADNKAATVVGTPTDGSGCGYTNGGIPVRLQFSNAEVKMPDCVRYRADGTNEVEGVTPSVLIPWRLNDSPLQRARRAIEVLTALKP
jgi:hypothetical protein